MKTLLFVTLLIFAVAATAFAQEKLPDEARTKEMHSGGIKIRFGIAFIAAGALAIPVTAGENRPSKAAITLGVGLIATGTYLVLRGARQQQTAIRPMMTHPVFFSRDRASPDARVALINDIRFDAARRFPGGMMTHYNH